MSAVATRNLLGYILTGDRPAPKRWMQSWRDLRTDSTYTQLDNVHLTICRWVNHALFPHDVRKRHSEVLRNCVVQRTDASACDDGLPDPQLFDDVAFGLDATPALPLTAQTPEEP